TQDPGGSALLRRNTERRVRIRSALTARQELFVNQSIVTPALAILWEFFRHGQLTWHGAFVNLKTGSMRPMHVRANASNPGLAQEKEV
ncbi:hypothetical protein PP727_19145, partial [Ralstonia solanacearum]|nr:hypothetical protein [Ralstonia solanacearum]MDC6212284.1 hypothetical protein [Ralstonia solanacearum]MDC6241261.1 hypothetical protein [Ralstonia solanacearum]MDD7802771.1 hypothetical protein [Ralstonia solanacearum]